MTKDEENRSKSLERFVTQPGDFILTRNGIETKIEDLPEKKQDNKKQEFREKKIRLCY